MMRSICAAVVLACLAGAAGVAHAVPTTFTFSGRLASNGTPFQGNVTLTLTLYDAAAGGTSLWSETQTTAADAGLVSIAMGTQTALDPADFAGGALWLAVNVNGTDLSPRYQLRSVPFALRAGVCDSADTLGTLAPGDVALATHNHDTRYYTQTQLNTAGTINTATNPMDWTKLKNVPAGLADGTDATVTLAGTGTAATAAHSDHNHDTVYAPIVHNHDTQYFTQSQLGTAGTINTATNPVDWTKLKNVPAAFADGVDDTVTLAGTGTAATAAHSDHDHDARYVQRFGGSDGMIKAGHSTSTAASATIAFPGAAFSTTPVVTLTPGTGASCVISSVTTTSVAYACNGSPPGGIYWIAID